MHDWSWSIVSKQSNEVYDFILLLVLIQIQNHVDANETSAIWKTNAIKPDFSVNDLNNKINGCGVLCVVSYVDV